MTSANASSIYHRHPRLFLKYLLLFCTTYIISRYIVARTSLLLSSVFVFTSKLKSLVVKRSKGLFPSVKRDRTETLTRELIKFENLQSSKPRPSCTMVSIPALSVLNQVQLDAHLSGDRRIFVGGLNYRTTPASLRSYFSRHGAVASAVIPRVQGSSRGFGFVEFETCESAVRSLASLICVVDEREASVVSLPRP